MAQTTLPPDVADKVLDKLSSSSNFREQFAGDPAGVLKSLGVDVDPAKLPAVRRLPSKAAIKANRAAYRAKLTGKNYMGFHIFEQDK
ncbi:MAG TPA: NHLP-related RiPP peptide [Myxococcaceae bacterium]|jgi:putative modified peptide